MEKDLAMYILVNKDITISKGKLAAQVGHAVNTYVYNLCFYSDMKGRNLIIDYMNGKHRKKIILYASQEMLEDMEKEGYLTIRDRGFTELEPDTLTCINVGIIDKKNIPGKFSFLKELRLCK